MAAVEETEELLHTRLACKLLDIGACRCTDYDNRHERVHDCIVISPDSIETLDWLPHSCAYRLISEGKDLHWWHPLVSGDGINPVLGNKRGGGAGGKNGPFRRQRSVDQAHSYWKIVHSSRRYE
jgi:hypothetical protein